MLQSLNTKQKLLFFSILTFMVIFILIYIYFNLDKKDSYSSLETFDSTNLIQSSNSFEVTDLSLSASNIIIYICGEVKESKVISLPENSRIIDAIEAVGGLTDNADLTNLNLALILEDGDKIYIPKIGENISSEDSISYQATSKNNSKKININKATQTEFETIPGIGPSTALKIISYREENGKFNSIEDIKNVSGIGDAKFGSIKDYISVK